MTLCFSPQQAPAVYAATTGTKDPVYVSPFVGRLDDLGQNGMDVVKNIKRMFSDDGHVLVLAASIRSLEHLFYCFALEAELLTVPAKILDLLASKNFPMPDKQFQYKAHGKPIPCEELTWSKGGKRLIFNTILRAKASRDSLPTIVQRFSDAHRRE